jgi:hypothetical protein
VDDRVMSGLRTGSFESLVAQPDTHVVVDLASAGDAMLILFGGIAGGVSMPVFEFFRVTADVPAKKAFLRDPRRGWYQLGIPGVGDSAADVAALLEEIIARAGAARVVMAGASAGGFAAMQFGALCGVDEVLAFSPQTFVDAENRRAAGDDRWPEQIAALHAAAGEQARTFDLLDVLPQRVGKTRHRIHVSTDEPLDLLHAHRIGHLDNVEIVEHEAGGHRLIKTLRDRGLLRPMLLAALGVPGTPLSSP